MRLIRAVLSVLVLLVVMSQSLFCQDKLPLVTRLEESIQYHKDNENLIGYLHIAKDRPIDDSTFLYVKFAVDDFIEKKVSFVVFDMDTPGGEVFAALKISKELKRLDFEHNIPVIAFVDNWALSAGALLAYSCRFIAVVQDASMGAAEPVTVSEGKMESASEKINSALRAEFSNTAALFGRDSLIAEAMVDKDMIIVERSAQIVELPSDADIQNSDLVISKKGKLLTLDAKQMMQLGVADFELTYQPLDPITKEERAALSWPFSKNLVSKEPFFSQIPNAKMIAYENPKVSFYSFLRHPLVASMLTLCLIVGIYVEINTPGFGVFGSIALASLALILLSNFAVETIVWLELIALILGATLLAIELFVLPGFGVIGFLGVLLLLTGLFLLTAPNVQDFTFSAPSWDIAYEALIANAGYFLLTLLISFAVIIALSRYISRRKFLYSRIVHSEDMDKDKGYVAFEAKKKPEIGEEGVAFTALRPSGKVLIHDTLYEAKTEFSFIEKGERVLVVRFDLGYLVVAKHEEIK